MRRVLVPFLVLGLSLAGCLTASGPADVHAPSAEELRTLLPIVQDHDHADPALHAGSASFELVGWHNGFSDDGAWPAEGGSVNELALHGDLAFVGRGPPQGGFSVLDVSDPTAPRFLGEFRGEYLGDIDVSSDGRWIFASTQRSVPQAENVLARPTQHTPRGVYVVDVQDPTAPRLESFFAYPLNGPHTSTYGEIDGKPYVFVQTYDLVQAPGAGLLGAVPATQRVLVTEFVSENGRMLLRPVSYFSVLDVGPGLAVWPHDSSLQRHPDGRWVLTVPYWDAGIVFLDVSDPRNPTQIARYTEFHPTGLLQLHDAKAFRVPVAGMHVTVGGPEIVTAPEDGQFTFLDTTDPAAPRYLGHWSLPGENVVDTPFIFSPHVFELRDDAMMFLGHNHGGVWAVDAADPQNPVTAGYHFPDRPREGYTGPIPQTWGVKLKDDLVFATDVGTGLYILRSTYARDP